MRQLQSIASSHSHAVMMIMICMNEMLTGEDNDVQLSSRKRTRARCNMSLWLCQIWGICLCFCELTIMQCVQASHSANVASANGTWSTLLSDPPGCTVLAVRRSMPCLRWNNAHNISRLLQSAAVQASNSCRASRKLFHVRHYSKWVYIIDAYIWSAYSLHMYVHMLTTHGNVS